MADDHVVRLHERHSCVRPVPLIPQQPNDPGNVFEVVRKDQAGHSTESVGGARLDIVFPQFRDHPVAVRRGDQQLTWAVEELAPAFSVEADVLVLGDELLKSSFVKIGTFRRFRHHGLTKQRLTGAPTELDQATTADKVTP
ncbi:hypothetical protein [Nocardia sp. NRRL S-836]|uniref:hypothetical protein n=1 Tax=Nocardia sp. NRRL S-836 TaxID=1519492 RepID=UPI0018D00175|nr:hypothetical protein [Nocardia sp. NRRL S-836]